MGLGIGRKLKKEASRAARKIKGGLKDITGQRNMAKGAKAQAQANLLERKRFQLQFARDRRKLVSQSRMAQAQNLISALASGGGFESSAARGIESAIGTDVGSRIGEAQEDLAFTSAIHQFESKAASQSAKGQNKKGLFDTGVGIVGSIFSDPRLKENVQHVGEENGYNIYTWTWNALARTMFGLTGEERGVMAHEVYERQPEAVSGEYGFLKVNYEMIGVSHG
jgi:hypothetical protein